MRFQISFVVCINLPSDNRWEQLVVIGGHCISVVASSLNLSFQARLILPPEQPECFVAWIQKGAGKLPKGFWSLLPQYQISENKVMQHCSTMYFSVNMSVSTCILTFAGLFLGGLAATVPDARNWSDVTLADRWRMQNQFWWTGQTYRQSCCTHQNTSNTCNAS